jgi:arylsulfatase A-like enzyme
VERTPPAWVVDLYSANPPATRVRRSYAGPVEAVAGPDGDSFAAVLADPAVPGTHPEQYSECFGNRSFYREGWMLVALHEPGRPRLRVSRDVIRKAD